MTSEYEAAKHILEGVWYASKGIGDGYIDFGEVDQAAAAILPSHGEKLLVELARNLYTGKGSVNLMETLITADAVNLQRIRIALDGLLWAWRLWRFRDGRM